MDKKRTACHSKLTCFHLQFSFFYTVRLRSVFRETDQLVLNTNPILRASGLQTKVFIPNSISFLISYHLAVAEFGSENFKIFSSSHDVYANLSHTLQVTNLLFVTCLRVYFNLKLGFHPTVSK